MKNSRSSIDGFVPRRIGSQIGELHDNGRYHVLAQPVERPLHTGDDTIKNPVGLARSGQAIGRSDIDESLREIDSLESPKNLSRRQVRRLKKQAVQRYKKKRSRGWRIIKWLLILGIIVGLGFAGYTLFQTYIAGGKIFKGNLFDILTQSNQPLKQDSNGRTNILVLGTSEDDPGHPAGTLTDSMMILSVDQAKKNLYMISIPRDLYVQYGQACASGYVGKINVYYSCVTDGTSIDAQRAALTKSASFAGKIFGLDIQYGVNVNYTVFRDVVNALGGNINVTINSRDPQGQMDSNFDWKCGASYYIRLKNCPPNGHYIQYTNGQHVIDAEHALYLAQARGDIAPTYGFEQSNFDREKNQQMIIKAIRDKAANVGFFTDVGKINGVIASFGNNLRTTFAANEVKTLISLAQNINNNDINTLSLIDGNSPIMTTGTIDSQSSVIPSAGTYNYSVLQAFIKKGLSSDPVIREGAPVAVYNSSGVGGLAQSQADILTADGFTVSTVASTPAAGYAHYELYQVGTGNPETKAKLEKILGVTTKTTTLPISVSSSVKFVIIIGAQSTTPTN